MSAPAAAPAQTVTIEPVHGNRAVVLADGRRVGYIDRHRLRGRASWTVRVGHRLISDLLYHEAARLAAVLHTHPGPMCHVDLHLTSPTEMCRCPR